ncbi:hypothetical protein Taro_003721 [Colocasia esculenta]|uniref:Glucan endo-1,3-beta-D-glucosidase n=1 Tax=Colocasia esculenta TaxID=4460 RepID=A0A843TSP4_COLES|nr:hypothetical protein [Colocasia esculenta]
MGPIVEFLCSPGAPLLVNVYPYFINVSDPQNVDLDYAQFTMQDIVVVDGYNGFEYQNLFDAMVDVVYAALDRVGAGNVDVVVSETSCLSASGFTATVENARIYNTCRQRYKATASFSLTVASQTYKLTCCFQSGVAKPKIRTHPGKKGKRANPPVIATARSAAISVGSHQPLTSRQECSGISRRDSLQTGPDRPSPVSRLTALSRLESQRVEVDLPFSRVDPVRLGLCLKRGGPTSFLFSFSFKPATATLLPLPLSFPRKGEPCRCLRPTPSSTLLLPHPLLLLFLHLLLLSHGSFLSLLSLISMVMAPPRHSDKGKVVASATPSKRSRPSSGSQGEGFDGTLFHSPEAFQFYSTDIIARKVHLGKRIDFDFFGGAGYDLHGLFEPLGWVSYVSLNEMVYPHLVNLFYANLVEDADKKPSTYVKGVHIPLKVSMLSEVMEIPIKQGV